MVDFLASYADLALHATTVVVVDTVDFAVDVLFSVAGLLAAANFRTGFSLALFVSGRELLGFVSRCRLSLFATSRFCC